MPDVTSIKIIIPGEPVPKGRHRARIVQPKFKPAFIHFYQDADTEKYETRVAQEAAIVMRGRGLILGALRLEVTAWIGLPKSWPENKKQLALYGGMFEPALPPTSRPDVDNYMKCALDALNGVAYKDDAQVTDITARKRYSTNPRLEIEIFAV